MSIAAIWDGQCKLQQQQKFSFSSQLHIINLAIEQIINNVSGISSSPSMKERGNIQTAAIPVRCAASYTTLTSF